MISKELEIYPKIQNRKYITWITRLWIEHYSLNKYLYHFNIIDSSEYEYENGYETIAYHLLKCEIYEEKYEILRKKIKVQRMRVEKLLRDIKLIEHTVKFIENTERFNF